MIRPKPASNYEEIDLKLGIKSSLPSVKSTLALLFLMWKEMDSPSELEYSVVNGNGIVLRPDIQDNLYQKAHSFSGAITKEDFNKKVSSNLMLKAQLEALLVAFELVWKVAKIRFTDGRSNSSERTGGARFPKKVWFTLNMDLFDTMCGNDSDYEAILFSWLGLNLTVNNEKEQNLIRFLTVISETSYYKLSDNGQDIIFNLESVYDTLLSQNESVDISGDKEPKGSLRILKSALSEDLLFYLKVHNNMVTASDINALKPYAERVSMFHQLDPKHYRAENVAEEQTATLPAENSVEELHEKFHTGLVSDFARNRILFGAPGTGKSYTLNHEKEKLLENGGEYERVTFHPDYSYANFVGTYKPVPCKDSDGKDAITYSYVPGPFMRTYVKAIKNSRTDTPKPFLLVIEEINRANVAAVFGDVFQLLDRSDNDISEYPIQPSEDIKKYLSEVLGGKLNDYAEIRIPDNMFIWATMNSADQGVFPMDTAFKRRWDFTYLGIDDSEDGIMGKKVILGQGDYRRVVEWNALRKAINNELLTYKVNEDKLMGPYFISKKNLPENEVFDAAMFTRIFKNKVIMYLFDDAAKQKRISLFSGCDEKAKNQYSKICQEFDAKGVYIFCESISNQFIDNVPEDDGE